MFLWMKAEECQDDNFVVTGDTELRTKLAWLQLSVFNERPLLYDFQTNSILHHDVDSAASNPDKFY